MKLRGELEKTHEGRPLDFYSTELKQKWANDHKIKTPEGEVTVVVPSNEEEEGGQEAAPTARNMPEARQSI